MKTWVDFWDGDHAIFVSDRHKRHHAAAIGRDISRLVPHPAAVVLDYGCGEAHYATDVALRCGRLILCEAADHVRSALRRRLDGVANVTVIGPAAVDRLADRSVDLIVANSLVQYLSADDLVRALAVWRRKLRDTGTLVVADVVPPDTNAVVDTVALLRFGWRGGFLLAALRGLLRTLFSDYGRLRAQLGFATYDEAGFLALLAEHGFVGERLRPNFGHNQARLAFRATPARHANHHARLKVH